MNKQREYDMNLKKAKELFKLAHKNLTPKQVKDTHEAEHWLEKHGVEAKRTKSGFEFSEERMNFSSYLYECYVFDRYLDFLLEYDMKLDVIQPDQPTQASWGDIKKGFDQAKDPASRKTHAKEGRKGRKSKLLGAEGSNPKIAKESESVPEFATKGLSLSPSDESGRVNTCSCATKECRAACLNKAGRGAMSSVQKARLAKTDFMIDKPHQFMSMLHDEIGAHHRSATKKGKRAAVRLNVVSDILYEKLHPEIFHEHPDVQFYDYTKIHGRLMNPDGSPKQLPKNYHVTLSSTGVHKESNWKHVRQHLDNGGVAAMVFAVPAGRGKKKGGDLPSHVFDKKTGKKYRVIDGDIHDHRHLDHIYNDAQAGEGLIAGLRIKGGKKMLEKAGDFAVKVPQGQTHVEVEDIH
jgi:hypothetical protein